jgi:hypothetical protein
MVVGETFATMGAAAREGAPPPEPPEPPEQPERSVRAARTPERRQREARRRAGEGVRRVIENGLKRFSGTVQPAVAFPK